MAKPNPPKPNVVKRVAQTVAKHTNLKAAAKKVNEIVADVTGDEPKGGSK